MSDRYRWPRDPRDLAVDDPVAFHRHVRRRRDAAVIAMVAAGFRRAGRGFRSLLLAFLWSGSHRRSVGPSCRGARPPP